MKKLADSCRSRRLERQRIFGILFQILYRFSTPHLASRIRFDTSSASLVEMCSNMQIQVLGRLSVRSTSRIRSESRSAWLIQAVGSTPLFVNHTGQTMPQEPSSWH